MADDETLIRKYLLCELDEDDQERFEKRLMTDDGFFEQLLVSEDELIDEYLAGTLNVAEKQRFERSFLAAPQCRDQFNFNSIFNMYVSRATANRTRQMSMPQVSGSTWTAMMGSLSRQSGIARALLLTTCLLVLGSSLLIVRLLQLQNHLNRLQAVADQDPQGLQQQLLEERSRNDRLEADLRQERVDRRALQEQLETLKTEAQEGGPDRLSQHAAQPAIALNLPPGLERGEGTDRRLMIGPHQKTIRIRLLLPANTYTSYRASITAGGGEERLLPDSLKPTGLGSKRGIVLTLAASTLVQASYRVRLYGGESEPVATYHFRVIQ